MVLGRPLEHGLQLQPLEVGHGDDLDIRGLDAAALPGHQVP